ncbi:MAG: hypothetical protein K0S29_836 [Gammaproteobacteria bacterium]|jgi:hypothetical protein|nr:hypothetical protein [Gammaproteobacteria bacterium]
MNEIIERLKLLPSEPSLAGRLEIIRFITFLAKHPINKEPDLGFDKNTCSNICKKLDAVLKSFSDIFPGSNVSNFTEAKQKAELFKTYCQECVIEEATDYATALLIVGIRNYSKTHGLQPSMASPDL